MTKICRKCIIKKCKKNHHHRSGTCAFHRHIIVDKLNYTLDEIMNSFGHDNLKSIPFEGDSLPMPYKSITQLDIELDIIETEIKLYRNKIEKENNDFIIL
jgi:hypothetical protein